MAKKKATAKKAAPAAAAEPDPRPAPSVRVRATKRGYYDRIREDGDEFLIRPPYEEERVTGDGERVVKTIDEFSTKWMERVSGSAPRKAAAKPAAKPAGKKSAPASGAATGDKDPLGAGD